MSPAGTDSSESDHMSTYWVGALWDRPDSA
jgi:hypothetical protein